MKTLKTSLALTIIIALLFPVIAIRLVSRCR